jgi:hypothetical protein
MLNRRTTGLIIVVFVALAGVAYLLDQAQQTLYPPLPTPTDVPLVFPGIAAAQITRLEVEDIKHGLKLTLVKQPGGWQGTNEKGWSVQARPRQIADMIQNLSTLRYNRVMEGSDVQAFGFAGGGFFVVRFDAGASYLLRVGDLNSDQSYAYVQRGNDPTVLQVPFTQLYPVLLVIIDPTLISTPAATSGP